MRIMTNNPAKYGGLEGYGLQIVDRVPLHVLPNAENIHYLRTKQDKLGHLLDIAPPRAKSSAAPELTRIAVGTYREYEGALDATRHAHRRRREPVQRPRHEAVARRRARRRCASSASTTCAVWWVPGAFEIPLVGAAPRAGGHDAVICLGAVIRGDTPHFDYVAGECASGVQRVALDTGTPVVFGVLTVDTLEQANERIGGSEGHKGEEAARTAVEMVSVLRQVDGAGAKTVTGFRGAGSVGGAR